MQIRHFLRIAAVLVLAGCHPRPVDPVEQALRDKITEVMKGDVTRIVLTNIQCIDSTTWREELERRTHVFELRYQQNENYYWEYRSKGLQKNAANKYADMEKDKRVLDGLAAIGRELADSLDCVAYYDYSFGVMATGRETQLSHPVAYATITPYGEVFSMSSDQRELHKSTGHLLPGYVDLVSSETLE